MRVRPVPNFTLVANILERDLLVFIDEKHAAFAGLHEFHDLIFAKMTEQA